MLRRGLRRRRRIVLFPLLFLIALAVIVARGLGRL
jgi:hypothetical protein